MQPALSLGGKSKTDAFLPPGSRSQLWVGDRRVHTQLRPLVMNRHPFPEDEINSVWEAFLGGHLSWRRYFELVGGKTKALA